MIARSVPIEPLPVASTSNAPAVALPGLVSSLRPVKRLATQLADEGTLLRRFTYKNKNQHKGCGWWRKVVEVDRVSSRLVAEVGQLLAQFEVDIASNKEIGVVSERALVPGLLRLSRSSAVADKTIQVLLSSSSVLEQLIASRAFLAFSVVVVALVARLHAIVTVLIAELAKASVVLVRLVKTTSHWDELERGLKKLPKQLRPYISLNPPISIDKAEPLSNATASRQRSPFAPAREEVGEIVSRDELKRTTGAAVRSLSQAASSSCLNAPRGIEANSGARSMVDRPEPSVSLGRGSDLSAAIEGSVPSPRDRSATRPDPSLVPAPLDLERPTKKKKIREAGEVGSTSDLVKKKKKKRKEAGEQDEIDLLWG